MPFIPGFDFDILLSAALPSDRRPDWIAAFQSALARRLRDRLQSDVVAFLGGAGLDSNASAAPRAALLIVAVSQHDAPADRERRERELDAFLRKVGDDVDWRRRVFVVVDADLPADAIPEAVRDLRTFDLSASLPSLERLTTAVARQLRDLRHGDAQRVRRPAVFLAEPAPDVTDACRLVRSHLEDHGYRVVPDERLSHAPPGYHARFAAALTDAQLFVQLLSRSPPTASAIFPGGFERWQFEQARSSGLPILQWRDPAAMAGNVRDTQAEDEPDFGQTAVACDLERFRRLILDQLKVARQSSVAAGAPDDAVLLLSLAREDAAWGEALREQTRALSVETKLGIVVPKLVLGSLSLEREAQRHPDFRGVIVIQGDAPREWVERQVLACRRLALSRPRSRPRCALWVAAHVAANDVWLPPCFRRLTARDRDGLLGYLNSLAELST